MLCGSIQPAADKPWQVTENILDAQYRRRKYSLQGHLRSMRHRWSSYGVSR